jgi:hypothetical protein
MPKMVFENNVIYEIDKDNQKQGPFCSACWDNNQKKIRLHTNRDNEYVCPVCKNIVSQTKQPVNKNTNHKQINIDYKKWLTKWKTALLFSLPTALLISISASADLVVKQIIQPSEYMFYFIGITLIALICISIPGTIALYKHYRHEDWVTILALCCFLPFGTILYLISLIWAIVLLFPKANKKGK